MTATSFTSCPHPARSRTLVGNQWSCPKCAGYQGPTFCWRCGYKRGDTPKRRIRSYEGKGFCGPCRADELAEAPRWTR